MNLPTKLEKVTLVDVVAEFRFKNPRPVDGLFFDFYTNLKEEGFSYEKLPIMDIPSAIRETDPNMTFQPCYKMQKGKYIISIGPKVLSFNIKGYYEGWTDYKSFILSRIEQFSELINEWELEHASMRYIDFFKNDNIFDKLKISINIPDTLCGTENRVSSQIYFNEILCSDGVTIRMQIADNSEIMQDGSTEIQRGGIIDLDAHSDDISKSKEEILDNLHLKLKMIFFNLLSDEFLSSLEPTYTGE